MSLEIVLECARKLQAQHGRQYWKTIGPDSEYFHPKSSLDSLAIVDLLVAVLSKTMADLTMEQVFVHGIPKTLGELAAKIDALTGRTAKRLTKLVILDCDDTLWEGVAQMGPVKIRGSVALRMRDWSEKGCLLALCSKNDLATVQMQLDFSSVHIAAHRINWQEKGQNVIEILNELNLLPENSVFLDNDPFERGRVQVAVPGIWCPEIAIDGSDIENALRLVDATIPEAVTDEDRRRAELYEQEAQRKQALQVASSYDEWLKKLGIEVTVRLMDEVDRARAEQLIEKAHQWKLTGLNRPGKRTLVAEYRDRYGDAGIIGVVVVVDCGVYYSIGQFVMSCRVIGRGVEDRIYECVCKVVGSKLYLEHASTENNGKAVEWAKKVNAAL